MALRVIPGQKTRLGPAQSLLGAYGRAPVGTDEHTSVRLVGRASGASQGGRMRDPLPV